MEHCYIQWYPIKHFYKYADYQKLFNMDASMLAIIEVNQDGESDRHYDRIADILMCSLW